MSTIRAFSLALGALFLFACSDDDGGLTGSPQPGQATGSCLAGQCLPGLICVVDKCQPGGGSGNSNSSPPDDPTGGTGETTDTTDGGNSTYVSTAPTSTTGEPPMTTTGVDTATTTTTGVTTNGPTTNSTQTTQTTQTTDPPDTTDSGDDSGTFIEPPDTGGEMCGLVVCDADEFCVPVGNDPQCLQGCDPLDWALCGPNQVCAYSDFGFLCAPDASGNTGAVGDSCSYANDCDPGNTCVDAQFVPGCNFQCCCSQFCDLDLADPCVQFEMQCAPWYEQGMAPPGLEDVGVCVAQ